MGKSLNQLGYELAELYRSTLKVTSDVDIRLFKEWVRQSRAQIIKQRLDTFNVIDNNITQDLGPVACSPVDSSSLISVPSGKYMLRTTLPIPASINRKSNIGTFTRISGADGLELNYNLVPMQRALISGNGRFNNNDVYVYLNGGYMYFISKTNIHKLIKYINIVGVFVNPEDAYTFNVNNVGTPWNDDMDFKVSESVVMDLQNMIIDKKFRSILTQIDDKVSNGADDTTVNRIK